MIDAILTLLQYDAALGGLLTGGTHAGKEISLQETPSAYDANKELLPCGLIRQEGATPWGPHPDSGRLYVTIWFYDRASYASIEAARKRVYALLHRQKLVPTDGSGNYEIRHANDLLDMEDPTLGAAMCMSRFVATVQRA